jgi:hypothetical protein
VHVMSRPVVISRARRTVWTDIYSDIAVRIYFFQLSLVVTLLPDLYRKCSHFLDQLIVRFVKY